MKGKWFLGNGRGGKVRREEVPGEETRRRSINVDQFHQMVDNLVAPGVLANAWWRQQPGNEGKESPGFGIQDAKPDDLPHIPGTAFKAVFLDAAGKTHILNVWNIKVDRQPNGMVHFRGLVEGQSVEVTIMPSDDI